MDVERDPEKDHGLSDPTGPPDGYHAVPEGRGQVVFLDDDGRPMSREEWLAYLEEKRREDGPREQ